MSRRKLTPIEMTALGIAWRHGPCTVYALMREFGLSVSSYYSSRTGTIYPLVERMLESGLMEVDTENCDKGERKVRVSEAGLERLREWITHPDQADFAHTADLIRLRFFYLDAVSPEARLKLVRDSKKGLKDYLALCENRAKHAESEGDVYVEIASRGLILETKARLSWLDQAQSKLLEELGGKRKRGRPRKIA